MRALYDITISILGNSMGGLYGRYAVAKLIDRHFVSTSTSWILDGTYRLRLNVFCTTASPHLGVSKHTWIRIPRIAELGVARTMGQTGSDLFRSNDLLYAMATDQGFLRPLASFRKRIAYANGYGTDFPVPVETAAFLSDRSTFPHVRSADARRIETSHNGNGNSNDTGGLVAALSTSADSEHFDADECHDELHRMSVSLDRLGWEKVFVDLRSEMPSVELPRWTGSMRHIVTAIKSTHENDSRDNTNNRLVLRVPVGHNMIVAFSRDRISSFLNKGGRPVVDVLAKELVHEIVAARSDDR
eukprot:jgi/Psemu1/258162/estExt_Genewise1Plus.C_2640007